MRFNNFFSQVRFTLQHKLLLSFLIIAILFSFLGLTTKTAIENGESAIAEAMRNNKLALLAKEANLNLAKAGQLPAEIAVAGECVEGADQTKCLEALETRLQVLQDDFAEITAVVQENRGDDQARELADRFIALGNDFYQGLAGFIPTRRTMLVYTTQYKGEIRFLPDVLTERELGHIRFVRSLTDNVRKQERLSGGTDFLECGFYQWYTRNPSQDEEVAEVLEEMDPLHQGLHNYAAEIDLKIEQGDAAGAEAILEGAERDLNRLGLYFAGLRNLAADKYMDAQMEFSEHRLPVANNFEDASRAAIGLAEYLEERQRISQERMAVVSRQTREKTAFSISLGLFIAIVVGAYVSWTINRSIKGLKRIGDELVLSAEAIDNTSTSLAENAAQTLQLADEATSAIEQTSSSIDAVAASIREMNQSISEISNRSVSSTSVANDAGEEVQKSATVIETLRQHSIEIGSVSEVIRTIAFKINLLALNANVEAARAGEAGNGFAVVATEVKNLANQTREATENIDGSISGIQKRSKQSSSAMSIVTKVIRQVTDNTSSIAASVEEQSAISNEIQNNIFEIVNLSKNTGENIQQVTNAAQDTRNQSEHLRLEKEKLARHAEDLHEVLKRI